MGATLESGKRFNILVNCYNKQETKEVIIVWLQERVQAAFYNLENIGKSSSVSKKTKLKFFKFMAKCHPKEDPLAETH